jgi:signal transduction histidine kinase
LYGGTGLGLAIVKQLVELQGGKLFVKKYIRKRLYFWFSMSFTTLEMPVESAIQLNKTINSPM